MSYAETIKLLNKIERAVDDYAEHEGDLPAKIVVSREAWASLEVTPYNADAFLSRILYGCKVMVLPAERMHGKEFELR